MECCPGC